MAAGNSLLTSAIDAKPVPEFVEIAPNSANSRTNRALRMPLTRSTGGLSRNTSRTLVQFDNHVLDVGADSEALRVEHHPVLQTGEG